MKEPVAIRVLGRDPCFLCGTRGDIGCRHQPAQMAEPFTPPDPEPDLRTRDYTGAGKNFRRIRRQLGPKAAQ